MREIMKKLGRELDETTDTLGVNHRLTRRTARRLKQAKIHYRMEKTDLHSEKLTSKGKSSGEWGR